MTIGEVIASVDALKPNQYDRDQKVAWLDQLDGRIFIDVIQTHEDADDVTFSNYDSTTADTTTLLVPAPYDRIYLHWLETCIDYENAEYTKYNNANSVFSSDYSAYRNWYNKNHMPLGTAVKWW